MNTPANRWVPKSTYEPYHTRRYTRNPLRDNRSYPDDVDKAMMDHLRYSECTPMGDCDQCVVALMHSANHAKDCTKVVDCTVPFCLDFTRALRLVEHAAACPGCDKEECKDYKYLSAMNKHQKTCEGCESKVCARMRYINTL